MFWKSKEAGKHIAHLAAVIEDGEEFSRRAKQAAQALGGKAIGKSRAYFWGPPDKPAELAGRFEGLGDWMAVCQAAIFEIWFHLGADALKELRSVAFGVYDWTQANATEVLCRLALNGIETEQTAAQIAKALPEWRYEQIMRVCGRVAELAARSDVLRQAYDQLTDEYRQADPVDGFELISAAARFSPMHVKARYGDFLRLLMAGSGLEGRTAFDDGHVVATADGKGVVAKSGPTYPQVEDFHRVRAAMLLHALEPDDAAVKSQLTIWSENHPDDNARRQLRELLARSPGSAPAI